MKKIGIIGGIGPESTIEYYRLIVNLFRERLSTNQYPEFFLKSIDMTTMLDLVFSDRLEELVSFLKGHVQSLEALNVDYVVLASNTPHLVFDKLSHVVTVEMISIVEETCKVISSLGLKRVGLLGTKSTMSKGFYQQVGARYGIDITIPEESDQDYVHTKYMEELIFNQIIPETKDQLIQIVNKLRTQEEIEGVILGGTELPLILTQSNFDRFPVLNTTAIHVEAIVNKMIN